MKIKKLSQFISYLLVGSTFSIFSTFAQMEKKENIYSEFPNINFQFNLNSGYKTINSVNPLIDIKLQEKSHDFSTLSNANLRLLIPLYDEKEKLLFFQGNATRNDTLATTTITAGLGGRFFMTRDFAFGANMFVDYLASQGNQHRFGIGGEALFNYGKIYGNFYHYAKDWIDNGQIIESEKPAYQSRAATGFDLGLQAYLPLHPQLGTNIAYKKSFGRNSVFQNSQSEINQDASQFSFALNYSPVSAITFSTEYRKHWNSGVDADKQQSRSSNKDGLYASLALTYRFGITPQAQFTFNDVNTIRLLDQSRYDFVERNNQIIFEHRKIPVKTISQDKLDPTIGLPTPASSVDNPNNIAGNPQVIIADTPEDNQENPEQAEPNRWDAPEDNKENPEQAEPEGEQTRPALSFKEYISSWWPSNSGRPDGNKAVLSQSQPVSSPEDNKENSAQAEPEGEQTTPALSFKEYISSWWPSNSGRADGNKAVLSQSQDGSENQKQEEAEGEEKQQ